MVHRCPECRKLLEAQESLIGRLCPYCETGLLEQLFLLTPDVLYESETGGWYDVEASS